MPLTDAAIAAALPSDQTYARSDEKGLYLLILPNGSRYWRFDYRLGGKRKTLSMGVYPEVGIELARGRRDEARAMVADGVDPSDIRKEARRRVVANIKRPSLLFSSDESGGMVIEHRSAQMRLNAEQVVALRAFLDATKEPPPCL